MLIHNAAWRLLGFVACTLPRAASAIYNTDNVKRGGKDRQKAEAEGKREEIFLKEEKVKAEAKEIFTSSHPSPQPSP
jgi:hypothetical protein